MPKIRMCPFVGRTHQPDDHVHGRAFARAVEPQETNHLTRRHRQGEVVDGMDTSKVLGQSIQ